jgi:hypothetical protein
MSFWYKPLSLEKTKSVTAVASTSMIEKLGGFWEITASGSRHLFAPIPYPLLSHKGTQQWVDSINQWANS